MQKGASLAKGEWLMFLHADCRMNTKWPSKINKIIEKDSNKNYAWFFKYTVRRTNLIWLLVELIVNIRSHIFQTPYGDQGLLINKELYRKVGGYKAIPIMEDLDLILRLKKITNLKGIGIGLKTSTRKYTKNNLLKNSLKNAYLRYLWNKGDNIQELAKKYYSE